MSQSDDLVHTLERIAAAHHRSGRGQWRAWERATTMMERTRQRAWTRQDSAAYYLVDRWGAPYFHVNARGNLAFTPGGHADAGPNGATKPPAGASDTRPQVDLRELVDALRAKGIEAPILVRFNDVLRHRVELLCGCFARAIQAHGYGGGFRAVMPIKVNQQRHVIEELLVQAAGHPLGLEAGSKPELLAAIALLQGTGQSLLVCNGYKDLEYVETALYAQWLGVVPYLVLDRFAELQTVLEASRRTGIRPRLGMRAKLAARGAGRWKDSSGERSKFGLSASEMVQVLEVLEREKLTDCLQLLHFHVGSQVTALDSVKGALREAGHIYAGLRDMGAHALDTLDCGGGLAVDYDGSNTDVHASMNYSLQAYANDVVGTLQQICDDKKVPHPQLITESGRALVAQHSLLVFNVLGVQTFAGVAAAAAAHASREHVLLEKMRQAHALAVQGEFQRAYDDVAAGKDQMQAAFAEGELCLQVRAEAEALFWATCTLVREAMDGAEDKALLDATQQRELAALNKELSDIYYCNFSVFQSLPDSWAIDQLFPIVPLHRHDEHPSRHAILADLTCDSDGKVDKFIDAQATRNTLRLHAPNGEAYYLGAFLVGAYQEILGDLHNLFGDTNAVHVSVQQNGGYTLEHVVHGDSVADVLGYVEYEPAELLRRVTEAAHAAVDAGRFRPHHLEAFIRRYEEGLRGYTYLEDID